MKTHQEFSGEQTENCAPDIGKFAALLNAVWPAATIYPPGSRFRVRNRAVLGYPIPNALRGRTGTVISVDGPIALGGEILSRPADVKGIDRVGLADAANLMGVVIEMVHFVRYDDTPNSTERLSHTWMESESVRAQPDDGWLNERSGQ